MDDAMTEIAAMQIESALVANDIGKEQILRTVAKFIKKTNSMSCTFSTVEVSTASMVQEFGTNTNDTIQSDGKVIEQHANCQIRFPDLKATKSELEGLGIQAQTRAKALHGLVGDGGNTYRFSKSMIYKMIGKLADFDAKYRGLSGITLNNDTMEAAGTISFKDIPDNGKWFTNPAFLDSFSQSGGFVMNGNDSVDLETELFVNHGWESMKIFNPKLDANTTYYSYVKMSEGKEKLWMGDVVIFDQHQTLVGILGGVSVCCKSSRLRVVKSC